MISPFAGKNPKVQRDEALGENHTAYNWVELRHKSGSRIQKLESFTAPTITSPPAKASLLLQVPKKHVRTHIPLPLPHNKAPQTVVKHNSFFSSHSL
jgi:hypothetical protein